MKKTVCGILLVLLLAGAGMFILGFNVGLVHAQSTVYINSDGSVSPSSAPISTVDNVTYTFTGNINYPAYYGVIIERSSIVIDGNGYTMQGNYSGNGISLTGVSNVTIENVNILTFQDGIYLSDSENNTVSGNTVTANNDFGIWLDSSSNNTVSRNNATSSGCGILLTNSSSNSINENTENNHHNGGYGILVTNSSSNNSIDGDSVTNNYSGIFIGFSSSNNNTISGSNISNNGDGIDLWFSSENCISGNNITANQVFGIYMWSSPSNNISGNNITANNDAGIMLSTSSNYTTISKNNIIDNSDGIDIGSSSNDVNGNNIASNNDAGIGLYGSSDNTICHNNFIDNTPQVYSSYSKSVWDEGYPSGGNYWSNYNGTDLKSGQYQNVTGSDGIGDTPYVIDENDIDNYPLMYPWSPYNITVTDVSCSKTVVYQGFSTSINVTVKNGGFSEDGWVTLYYDITENKSISAYPVHLEIGQNCSFTFVWNTAVIPCGNYTLTAVATMLTGSNTLSDGNITVRLLGDVNGDGRVDLRDIALIARNFGTTSASPRWNAALDLNADGIVDMKDIALVARHFGQHT